MSVERTRFDECVSHIIEAVERIETYTFNLDMLAFKANTLVQDAVIRNIEIIGEAAGRLQKLDPELSDRRPDLHLDLAYRMRNALIHGYEAVNLEVVWNTVQTDLKDLRTRLRSL